MIHISPHTKNSFGALAICIDQWITSILKERTKYHIDEHVLKFKIQFECKLAALFSNLCKSPASLQMSKRTIDQLYLNCLELAARIAGRKVITQRTLVQLKCCFNDLNSTIMYLGTAAPWKKLRVRLNIIDENEHLASRIRNESTAIDSTHNS